PAVKTLNCGEIRVGEFDFDPIFGTQNDPQFLLDKRAYKPADLNAILGAFGGTERLEAGKKEAGSQASDKNGEAKTVAEEIRAAEERKAKLMVLSANSDCLLSILHKLEQGVRTAESQSVWVTEALKRHTLLQPLQRLQEALVLPDPTFAMTLTQQVTYLTQAAESRVLSKWLDKVVKIIDGGTEQWDRLYIVWKQIIGVTNLQALLASRHEFPDISGDTEVRYSAIVRLYSSIKTIGQVLELRKSLKAKAAELTQIDLELTEQTEELKKGLCPKCGVRWSMSVELEQTQDRLKQIKTRVTALQSGRDKINQQKGLEQGKLDEAYKKLRELGFANPEAMNGKELQGLADKLEIQLTEEYAALETQVTQGETLMQQYRELG